MINLRNIIVLLCGAFSLTGFNAAAQNYVNVTLTGNATNSIAVPTNTIAKLVGWQGQQATSAFCVNPSFPRSMVWGTPVNTSQHIPEILGPCVISFESLTNVSVAGSFSLLLIRFESVNATQIPSSLVQPAGMTATLTVESSTNLTTWQTITNATFGATNSARFFRTSLSVP